MHDSGIDPQDAQSIHGVVKTFLLLARLPPGRGIGENFRRSKMRHHPAKPQMSALGELPRETLDLIGRDAQAIHSRVNFQVERKGFSRCTLRRGFIEWQKLFAAMNDWSEIVRHHSAFLAGNKTGEN